MCWTILGYIGYHAVPMHVVGLWFCWCVDFSLAGYVAALNVFVGAGSFCTYKNIQDRHTLNQRKNLVSAWMVGQISFVF
jgi:hypothetical protein